jgi:hypothetical protein
MRPLTVLLGIIMGSSVAMAVSLAMTAIVFVLLGDSAARYRNDGAPLLRGLIWSWSAVAISVTAFYGMVHGRPWRAWAASAVFLMLAIIGLVFWPR